MQTITFIQIENNEATLKVENINGTNNTFYVCMTITQGQIDTELNFTQTQFSKVSKRDQEVKSFQSNDENVWTCKALVLENYL